MGIGLHIERKKDWRLHQPLSEAIQLILLYNGLQVGRCFVRIQGAQKSGPNFEMSFFAPEGARVEGW